MSYHDDPPGLLEALVRSGELVRGGLLLGAGRAMGEVRGAWSSALSAVKGEASLGEQIGWGMREPFGTAMDLVDVYRGVKAFARASRGGEPVTVGERAMLAGGLLGAAIPFVSARPLFRGLKKATEGATEEFGTRSLQEAGLERSAIKDEATRQARIGTITPTQARQARGLTIGGESPYRRMTAQDAVTSASSKSPPHIRPGYPGAPPTVTSPRSLATLRGKLQALLEEGQVGRDWYDRSAAGNLIAMGPGPGPGGGRSAFLANLEASNSAQRDVRYETRTAVRNIHQLESGLPATGHSSSRRITEAFGKGELPTHGPKVGIYTPNKIPAAYARRPHVGVNDMWMLRAFGYPEGGAQDIWHTFMDGEILRLTDWANRTKLGGFDDWTPGQVQASIWVRQKGGWEYPDDIDFGMREAMKTTPEFMQEIAANATSEFTPELQGHLPGLLSAAPEDRLAYQRLQDFLYEGGVPPDVLAQMDVEMPARWLRNLNVDEAGRPQLMGHYAVGSYGGRTNPVTVTPVLTDATVSEGVSPSNRAFLNAVQAHEGYLGGQQAAGWHHIMPGAPAGQKTSLLVEAPVGSLRPEEIEALAKYRGDWLSHSGVSDLPINRNAPVERAVLVDAGSSRELLEGLKSGQIPKDIEEIVPGATVSRVGVQSNLIPIHEGAAPGSGLATDRALAQIEQVPGLEQRLSAPSIQRTVAQQRANDEILRARGELGPVRDDLQNARKIFAGLDSRWPAGGWPALRAARLAGESLPVLVGGLLGLRATGSLFDLPGGDDSPIR